MDDDDDWDVVFREDLLHEGKMIRPICPTTQYSSLRYVTTRSMNANSLSSRSLEEMMQENRDIVKIADSDFRPDLDFEIINNDDNSV